MYLAYIPTSLVDDLATQIKAAPNSDFYTKPDSPVAKQLAQNVDPSFSILTTTGGNLGVKAANVGATDSSNKGGSNDELRNALIGVGCALFAVIVAFFGYRYWKRQQKKSIVGANANGRPQTIHSFGGGALRETWAPNRTEQERVLNGQLAETWAPDAQQQHGAVMRELEGDETFGDPFMDPVDAFGTANNRASGISGFTRRSGHSGLSGASGLTEAQRIQQEYQDQQGTESAQYLAEYEPPQQYTSQHAHGPRAADNRKHNKRTSVASSTISRPEMRSNSMLF